MEVELVQKSERRYAGLWEDYRRKMPDGGLVLYLTGWKGLRDTLFKRANERQFPMLYGATLRDFRAARERCVFSSWRSVNQKADEFQIVAGEAAAAAGRAA